MSLLFEIKSLSFRYPSTLPDGDRLVLSSLEFRIEEGEFISIVGANGSGKSTLAKILNALLLPTEGRVLIAGMDSQEPQYHARIRNLVGMVFQFPEDQVVSTVVEEDVAFGPANLGLPRAEIRRRVADALERVGLSDQRLRPPHLLSAGQLQRLALAGVLAIQPRCIIFDEATTMLDPIGRKMVMQLMKILMEQMIISLTPATSM